MFPNIGSIMIQGFERGKLREYTNNKNPNLTFLELSFNELVNITGNDFSKLSQLLIGNNYLGEIGIENLITKNTWTKGTLTVINISRSVFIQPITILTTKLKQKLDFITSFQECKFISDV